MNAAIKNKDLLFPELSFQVVGILFEDRNTLGYGYLEKYYQKAIASLLKKSNINFEEQVKVEIIIGDESIAKGFADLVIEDKIILEIKKGDTFRKSNIDQLYSYLKMKNMQLGILANFTSKGLLYKRILNIRNTTIGNSPIRNS